MKKLYSYCIPSDDGAAPNPFWRICTLNICKPVIRRTAKKGDWVVGTGSKQFGFENMVVYAMEITQTMPMEKYQEFCENTLQNKIPSSESNLYEEKVGDCIYDFRHDPPKVLKSVHTVENRSTDLRGKNTLLSDHFYYFGDKPEPLPNNLLAIVKQGQGHKSTSNEPYVDLFIDWILTKTKAKNGVYSNPKNKVEFQDFNRCRTICSRRDKLNNEINEELGEE